MSKKDNRKMISAYEKMLQDGTAFKEVDLTMHSEPSMVDAGGSAMLGEPINENDKDSNIVEDDGYGEFDSIMEQKMSNLRQKAGNRTGGTRGTHNSNSEIMSLKKRVKRLEEALVLVMETQTTLIEGG